MLAPVTMENNLHGHLAPTTYAHTCTVTVNQETVNQKGGQLTDRPDILLIQEGFQCAWN